MSAGSDWSAAEVSVIVADYFDMLQQELFGQSFKKTEHRQRIAPLLPQRSKGSIEFKHQNISAVLIERGLPYIEGYKPRGNYQDLLAQVVDEYLSQHSDYIERVAQSPVVSPPDVLSLPLVTLEGVLEAPPEHIVAPLRLPKPWITRKGQQIDFAARDAANRRLARLGEEFVVTFERQRLQSVGRNDLAAKVDWISQTRGDGLGFDVLSFDETDESESLIEVKTTGLGKFFPFYVTANEVRCSEDTDRSYRLYRVFDFIRRPRLYTLRGALSTVCQLEPMQYRATI